MLLRHFTKAITLPLLILISFQSKAGDYLQIGFTSNAVIPTVTTSGDSLLLDFHDPNLDAAFVGYKVVQFTQEYPSVVGLAHSSAALLARVYKIKVATGSSTTLKNTIVSLSSSDVDNVFLLSDPIIFYEPNDYNSASSYSNFWGFGAVKHLELVNAKAAWDITRGLDCIKVGISDIGFTHHTDLDANVVNLNSLPAGVNLYNASGPWDSYAGTHGTEVASMVAAITDNGMGIASLGNKVKVAYYNWGNVDYVLQAANDGCKVVNCSWGHGGYSAYEESILNIVYGMGVTVVAGAGNTNTTAYFYPASYDHVISVTSVGSEMEVGTYVSNPYVAGGVAANWKDCHRQFLNPSDPRYNTMHSHNDKVDICAPGYWVICLGGLNDIKAEGGTSLASPQVAAAAALLYSLNPNFTPTQVEDFLKNSAHNIYSTYDNNTWAGLLGAGRLDAGAALNLAANSTTGGCQPRFTDIIWQGQSIRSGAYSALANNYDAFTFLDRSSNNTLQFSLPTTPSATVEWEFYLNGNLITKSGTTVTLNLADYPGGLSLNHNGRAPLSCVNTLEVYVRQGSGCCYSAYYKEDASNPACIYIKSNQLTTKLPSIDAMESKIKIYPSPANSVIQVTVNENSLKVAPTYQIISVGGECVKTGSLTGSSTLINISTLSKGVYLFRTALGNVKFIKE
jgi:subtilisin family serine protease